MSRSRTPQSIRHRVLTPEGRGEACRRLPGIDAIQAADEPAVLTREDDTCCPECDTSVLFPGKAEAERPTSLILPEERPIPSGQLATTDEGLPCSHVVPDTSRERSPTRGKLVAIGRPNADD